MPPRRDSPPAPPSPASQSPVCVIREVDPRCEVDTKWAAQLHCELFADIGLVAQLGERILQRFCYGRLVKDHLLRVVLALVDQQPAGLLAFTIDSQKVHRAALGSHFGVAARELLVATILDPRILRGIPGAVRLLWERRRERGPARGAIAEVLTLGVRQEYRCRQFVRDTGIRINDMLLRYALVAAKAAGIREGRGVILATNRPAVAYGRMRASRVASYPNAAGGSVEIWYDVDEALRIIDRHHSPAPQGFHSRPRHDGA